MLTKIKIRKWGHQSNLIWNGTSKIIVIYCIWWKNVRSIKMAMWGNKRNYSKWKQKNTQFNYLLRSRSTREVISPISLGMEPVREFSPNAFGCKMWEVWKWHCGKFIRIEACGSRKILNSTTYPNQVLYRRSTIQSH